MRNNGLRALYLLTIARADHFVDHGFGTSPMVPAKHLPSPDYGVDIPTCTSTDGWVTYTCTGKTIRFENSMD